jgi:hypothetical protein
LTAEILVMNRDAIAVASDSASTLSPEKIFNANKIFALSKKSPVGIMFYDSALFMGIPWETLTKEYRKEFGDKKFSHLDQYSNNFFRFLMNQKINLLNDIQKEHFLDYLDDEANLILKNLKKKIIQKSEKIILEKGQISFSKVEKITIEVISNGYSSLNQLGHSLDFSDQDIEEIIDKYGDSINENLNDFFENIPITKVLDILRKIVVAAYIKWHITENNLSGVVFFGFGENEYFPSYKEYGVYGFINNQLRYEILNEGSVSFEHRALIAPIAQRDVVDSFIKGILPHLEEKINLAFFEAFEMYEDEYIEKMNLTGRRKNQFKKISKEISGNSIGYLENSLIRLEDRYISSLMNVVTHLSKDELAEMAEFFINLISVRRRMTMSAETVSGPIDVAIISKGEGFIWIKRKHYFSIALNPDFPTKNN